MNFPDPNLRPFVIVDDCEDDVFVFRHRLREGDIANPITTFACVREALSYLMSLYGSEPLPYLISVDIRMPGGFDLIAALRADPRFDGTRIVVVTYSNVPSDLQRALELRIDGYILKFPDADLLAEFVRHGPWFEFSPQPTSTTDALCA